MMDDLGILDEYAIQDPETLKVVGDPLRIRILEQVSRLNRDGQLATAKQLASALEVQQTKLYYHLNLLEEHGLITVGETALVSGIVEKHYRVRAWRLTAEVGSKGGGISEQDLEGMLAPVISILDRTRQLAEETLRATNGEGEGAGDEAEDEIHVQQTSILLTPEEANEFVQRMEALVNEFRGRSGNGLRSFHLTTVFLPLLTSEQVESEA